jgi:hypothetical protein
VQYNGSVAKPGFSGRWDLRGKKFLTANKDPLKSWGVCVIDNCVQETALKHFIGVLVATYISHGGRIANKNPYICYPPSVKDAQLGGAVEKFHDETRKSCQFPSRFI